MGTVGDNLSAPTCTDRRFSTIHTPYCSLFLLDLKETKKTDLENTAVNP